jgi:hypothetical protein
MKLRLREKPKKFHPEQEDNEVFISFENKETFKQIKWKTKRLGKQGYELIPMYKGELIPIKGLFPCFIKEQEMIEYKEAKFKEKENKK